MVSWAKAIDQSFGGLLDDTVQLFMNVARTWKSVSFPYLGSGVHNNGGSCQELTRRIALTHGVRGSHNTNVWGVLYLYRRTKLPVSLYGNETTLNTNLERRLYDFGTECLCRVMRFRWNECVSNLRLYAETG